MLLLLNLHQQSDDKIKPVFESFWNKAALRVLVDGGANWFFDHMKESLKAPHIVCGDFDSIRSNVKQHFTNQVCNKDKERSM